MITPINLFIAFLWFLSAIVDYADFCYIWQLKEYRWDRMRDFLSTEQGKYYWIRWQLLWRSLIAIIIFFWPFNDDLTIKYILIVLFAADMLRASYKLFKNELRHPKPTKKAIILVLLSAGVEGILFILTRDWTIFLLLLIIRFFILSGVIFFLNRFTDAIKTFYIKKARQKLAAYSKLVVIGVTGSYGKTTVKNYLNHILSKKLKVIATPEHTNTDIGIAKVILNKDFSDKDVFIVEMGAYRVGEIKNICDMIAPKIGILTGINEQHLSLFGSIEKTKQAKFELLQALPKDGLAVVNCDNPHCREKLDEIGAEILTFGIDSDCYPTLLIKETKANLYGLSCRGEINSQEFSFEAPVVGEYNAMNFAPCFLVALNLGLTMEEIKEGIKSITTEAKILKYGNCDVINDSYNSNPDGFRAALEILNKFPSDRKRIIITRGMLELGEKSDEIHEKIAEEIELVADELVVITKDFAAPMRKALDDKYRTNFVLKENPCELLEYVKGLKETNSVILIENRVPAILMKELGL